MPVTFTANTAARLVNGGIQLNRPVTLLYAEPNIQTQGFVLYGKPAPLEELVSDPAVQKTLARSLDLLEACAAIPDELPPIVAQAARRLTLAVESQQRQAIRKQIGG
jgi:hypothetical protein